MNAGKLLGVAISDTHDYRKLYTPRSTPRLERRFARHKTCVAQASGKVTVAVAEVLPLAEAARAHALIEKSHAPGKIVLTV